MKKKILTKEVVVNKTTKVIQTPKLNSTSTLLGEKPKTSISNNLNIEKSKGSSSSSSDDSDEEEDKKKKPIVQLNKKIRNTKRSC